MTTECKYEKIGYCHRYRIYVVIDYTAKPECLYILGKQPEHYLDCGGCGLLKESVKPTSFWSD